MMIKNLKDLCKHFSADTPDRLPERIYKYTECGAWIGLLKKNGKYLYNGNIADRKTFRGITGFNIGTIVEGWDGDGVMAGEWTFPVKSEEIDHAMKCMEEEADRIATCINEHPEGCGCLYPF